MAGPTDVDLQRRREMNALLAEANNLMEKESAYTQDRDRSLSKHINNYETHLEVAQGELKALIKLQREEGEKFADAERLEYLKAQAKAYRQQQKELDKLSKKMDKLKQQTKDVADAVGDWVEGMTGMPSGWERSLTAGLIKVRKGTVSAESAAGMLSERFKGVNTAMALEYQLMTKLEEALAAYLALSVSLTLSIDEGIASFEKSTSVSDDYADAINNAAQANIAFGISGADMGGSFAVIQQRIVDLSPQARGTGQQLAELGAKMGRLGVDTESQGKFMHALVKGMHMAEGTARKYTLSIIDLSTKLKKGLNATIADFNELMPKLLVHGDKATKVFENLSVIARKAGISVGTLMGAVGQTFDTFEGAADATQALNAILGGPYLNAIDMVHMKEDERAKTLIGMFKASGRAYKDLDRYSKKAIMHKVGITDAAEAEAFFALSISEANSLLSKRSDAVRVQEELNKRLLKAQPIMENLKNAAKGLGLSLVPMLKYLRIFTELLTRNIGKFQIFVGIMAALGTVIFVAYKIIQFQMIFALIRMAGIIPGLAASTATLAGAQTAAGVSGKVAGAGLMAAGKGAAAATPGFAGVGLTIAAVVGSIALLLGGIAALKVAFSDPPDIGSLSKMDPAALSNLDSFVNKLDKDKVEYLEEVADSFERIGKATRMMKPMLSTAFGKKVMADIANVEVTTAGRTAAGTTAPAVAAAGAGTTILKEAKLYIRFPPENRDYYAGVIRDLVLGDDMNVIVGRG